jgi:hypothetical protein
MKFQEIATDLAVPKRKNAVIAVAIVVLVIVLKMLYGSDSATFGSGGRYGPIIKGWQLGPMGVEEFMAIAMENGEDHISFFVGEGNADGFTLKRTDDGWDIHEKGVFSESFSGGGLSFDEIANIFEREAEKHPSAYGFTGFLSETSLVKKNGSFRLIKIGVGIEQILGKGNSTSVKEFAQTILNEFGLDELETDNGYRYYSTNDNARGWSVFVNQTSLIVSEVERANFN